MAPQDQRHAPVCIFGAVCPQGGKGAALVLPSCDAAAMNLHLAGISSVVSLGYYHIIFTAYQDATRLT